MWSFSRKMSFFKAAKGGKFVMECVSNDNISLKCLFYPSYEFYGKKTFTVGKTRESSEKGIFTNTESCKVCRC